MNKFEEVVPSSDQFNPMEILLNNETDDEVRAIKAAVLIATAAETSTLPQELMVNAVTTMPEPGKGINGVIAPIRILGPKVSIKAQDIKPGMNNIGYYKFRDSIMSTVQFTDTITRVEMNEGELHIYGGETLVRNDPNKHWFVQHIWEHAPVIKYGDKLTIQDVEKDEILMRYTWDGYGPTMQYFQMSNETANLKLLYAYESVKSAVYRLTPKLVMPSLPDAPIPAMPGSEPKPEPKPSPEEEKPESEGKSEPIPPMPGEIKDEWIKPETKDWWIS